MIPVFESRDDYQKALAAFLLFQKAAEAEQVTLGLLQEVASSLGGRGGRWSGDESPVSPETRIQRGRAPGIRLAAPAQSREEPA